MKEEKIVIARLKNRMFVVGIDDGNLGIRNPRELVLNHVQKMYDLLDFTMGFGEKEKGEDFWIPKEDIYCQRKAIQKIRDSYIQDETGVKVARNKIVDLKGKEITGGLN